MRISFLCFPKAHQLEQTPSKFAVYDDIQFCCFYCQFDQSTSNSYSLCQRHGQCRSVLFWWPLELAKDEHGEEKTTVGITSSSGGGGGGKEMQRRGKKTCKSSKTVLTKSPILVYSLNGQVFNLILNFTKWCDTNLPVMFTSTFPDSCQWTLVHR